MQQESMIIFTETTLHVDGACSTDCMFMFKVIPPSFHLLVVVLEFTNPYLFSGKKDGDDGSIDQIDIPKRTAPAKGIFLLLLVDYSYNNKKK